MRFRTLIIACLLVTGAVDTRAEDMVAEIFYFECGLFGPPSADGLRGFLANEGVTYPKGSVLYVDTSACRMIVYNTPANIARLRRILERINVTPANTLVEVWIVSDRAGGANDLVAAFKAGQATVEARLEQRTVSGDTTVRTRLGGALVALHISAEGWRDEGPRRFAMQLSVNLDVRPTRDSHLPPMRAAAEVKVQDGEPVLLCRRQERDRVWGIIARATLRRVTGERIEEEPAAERASALEDHRP